MISVVIPAFNEETAIVETLSQLRAVLSGAGLGEAEIVVVDDGSTDRTGDLAAQAGVTVVRNLQNQGYGYSLKRGIQIAKYDTIVITDADGTYPLQEIPKLVGIHKRGYHMVVGMRSGDHYKENIIKAPLREILRWLVEFTAGRSIPDINSGLRVFSKPEVKPFFPHLSNAFSFTTSITLAYMLSHKSVEYVPIDYKKRVGTTKVRLMRDSLRMLQYVVQAILFYNPQKLYVILTLMMLVFGAVMLALSLIVAVVPVWLGLLCVPLAILVFAIGQLAELMRQIHLNDRN